MIGYLNGISHEKQVITVFLAKTKKSTPDTSLNYMYIYRYLVVFFSFAVKHLKIEKNTSQNASQFEPVTEKGKGPSICSVCLHTCLNATDFK